MGWGKWTTRLVMGVVLSLALGGVWSSPAAAHETDNFSKPPPDRRFADWGRIWTRIVHRGIENAVDHVNDRIRRAESGDTPLESAEALRGAGAIQEAVRRAFPPTLSLIDEVDRMVATEQARRRFPGKLTYHRPFEYIYSYSSFPLDPRQFFKLWRAAHMKIDGVYMGSDKLGHFLTKGHIYYRHYRSRVAEGMSRDAAIRAVVAIGVGEDLFLSEKRMLGYWSSGVLSHADLAADYAGLKFYMNLTEPVRVAGETRPPMVELVDGYWRVAEHVRRDTDFFSVFLTDHFDEALNPNILEPLMRRPVRMQIEAGCTPLLERHRDRFGNRRSRQWFERRRRELSTYFGESYGHQGRFDEMVDIANTCFPEHEFADPDDRSPLGRTPLHQAVIEGDRAQVEAWLAAGAEVDAAVRSREPYASSWGDRPLHYAARAGRVDLARVLLEGGADVNAANDRGVTPLHRAVQVDGKAVVDLLLETGEGAAVDARDEQGRTPLHWAATYPRPAILDRLIAAGGDVAARDHRQRTPLHHASEWGQVQVIERLIEAGGDIEARAALGMTPMHVAARHGRAEAVAALLEAGGDPTVANDMGRTPLHVAAAHTHTAVAEVLLGRQGSGGSLVHARDGFGFTPLHEAARDNNPYLIHALIDAGGDPNAANHSDRTPLHVAARAHHEAALEALRRRGGDERRPDREGQTPRMLLKEATPNLVDYFVRLGSLPDGR